MDAAGFVALFRASNVVWHEGDADPPRWIFRGHRNAAWRLKPRAWRTAAEGNPLHSIIKQLNSAAIEYHDEIKSGTTLHQALAWTHAERIVLNEFRRIGWQLGFDLNEPLSSYSMDMELFPPVVIDNTRDNECFSPFISSSDIGVAQHHGVPTRFLDWTFNPIFAVFFALDDYEQGLDQTDLCVWALDMRAIDLMLYASGGISRNLIRTTIPRRHGNDFITAQDGLLLEIEHTWAVDYFEQNGTWPSLEEVVVTLNQEPEYNEDNSYIYDADHPMLRRIVLAASEVPALRLILEREGITREKLMPTLRTLHVLRFGRSRDVREQNILVARSCSIACIATCNAAARHTGPRFARARRAIRLGAGNDPAVAKMRAVLGCLASRPLQAGTMVLKRYLLLFMYFWSPTHVSWFSFPPAQS